MRVREGHGTGPRRSQVCQDMSRQRAAEFRSCGRELRRSLPLPHSLPPGGGGGGEVTSAPRLAPRPAARTGSSCGVRLPDSSNAERGAGAASLAAALCARRRVALSTGRRVPGSAERRRSGAQHPSGPGAPRRAPPRCSFLQAPSRSVSHASNCR